MNLGRLGAEPKKVVFLGALAVLLGYLLYSNFIAPSDDGPPGRVAASRTPAKAPTAFGLPQTPTRPRTLQRAAALRAEFRMPDREHPEDGPDPTSIDPTLRLDLLAKMQSVNLEGGERNLFQFGAAPLPKVPEQKILPKPAGPETAAAAAAGAPVKPPPPPIPLKFYGYTSQGKSGQKRAFFLDGDDIVVVNEGDTIKNRYKVVRVNLNSVVVEDTQFQHQQTLPLEEQAG